MPCICLLKNEREELFLTLLKEKPNNKPNSKPNNKYMQSYDVNKPSKFIIYLDASKLYGWSISLYLSYGRFKLLNRGEVDQLDVNSIKENSPIRYILEVDLEYPAKEFEKWRAIRGSVGGVDNVVAWVAWVMCLHGWCTSVAGMCDVLAWVAWVACLHG